MSSTHENTHDHCFKYSFRHVTWVYLIRSPAVTLSCSFIWNKYLLICLSLCLYLGVRKISYISYSKGKSLMKKRACGALPCVVSPVLEGLPLKGVFPICAACALLLYHGHFIREASCQQRLSLLCGQRLVPCVIVRNFNQVFSGLLVK